MPIGPNSKLIQVVISKTTYEYLKKYSYIFNCSISDFCNQAICTRILKDNNIQLGDEHNAEIK